MIRISKVLLLAAIFTFCAAYVSVQPASTLQVFRPPMQSGQTITCSSDDGNRHYCNVDTRRGVWLSRQISGSACVETRSWGYDNRGIWVDRGCRAEFVIGRGGGNGGDRDWERGQTITCSSDDGGRNYCSLPRGVYPNDVRMNRQISGSPCIPNRTWGVDRRGLWVDRGCRAEFVVANGSDGGGDWQRGQIITCSSNDGGRNYCSLPRGVDPDDVRMIRQISGSRCLPNRTWGIDRRGLWVDRGCRAEFQVNRR